MFICFVSAPIADRLNTKRNVQVQVAGIDMAFKETILYAFVSRKSEFFNPTLVFWMAQKASELLFNLLLNLFIVEKAFAESM